MHQRYQSDGNSIKKFERTGTLIGTLTAVDGDDDDSHTFQLVSGSGTRNELFFIDGDQLVSNHMFDDVCCIPQNPVKMDSAGLTFQKNFTITVINASNPGGRLIAVTKVPADGGLVAGAGYYDDNEKVNLVVKNSPITLSGHSGMWRVVLRCQPPSSGQTRTRIITNFTQGYHKVVVDVTDRHGYAWGGGIIQHGTEITVRAKGWTRSNVAYLRTGVSTGFHWRSTRRIHWS